MRKDKMTLAKDIDVLGSLLQVLQMTKQGSNIASISLISGNTRSIEIAFVDGKRQEFAISEKLHGLSLIAKVISVVQGRCIA